MVIFVAISWGPTLGNRLLMEQIRQLPLFMVKDTKQNNLYYFNIFFKVKQKNTQVTVKK